MGSPLVFLWFVFCAFMPAVFISCASHCHSSVVSLVSWRHHYGVRLTIISCQALSYIISNIVTHFKMHIQAGFKLGI